MYALSPSPPTTIHVRTETRNDTAHEWQHVYDLAKASPDVDTFMSGLNLLPEKKLPQDSTALGSLAASDTAATVENQPAPSDDKINTKDSQNTEETKGYVKLTKDLAEAHSKDKIVLVTWTNLHFLDFVENWISHLLELGRLP